MNQRGSVPILPVVIAAALGVGLAASMYLNWSQYQKAQDDKRQLQGTITDLKYQVEQDQKVAVGDMPSPSPAASAAPSPTPGVVAGAQTLAIPKLGVKVSLSAPLNDLVVDNSILSQTSEATVVGFSSPSVTAQYPKCKEIGQLVRRPLHPKVIPAGNIYLATVGNYKFYFYYPAADSQCDSPNAEDVLLNNVLKTLTAI